MRELLYLLLGWLLGLLSPGIAERVRRKRRERDLVVAIVGELTELQYTLATAAYRLRAKVGQATNEFLDRLLPVFRSYSGPDANPKFVELVTQSRELDERLRQRAHLLIDGQDRGLALKRYEVPFLLSQANELSICSLDFQRRIFRVKGQLDLFNQHVLFVHGQFEKTFDASVMSTSSSEIERNLTEGYTRLATDAEYIVNLIDEIKSRHTAS